MSFNLDLQNRRVRDIYEINSNDAKQSFFTFSHNAPWFFSSYSQLQFVEQEKEKESKILEKKNYIDRTIESQIQQPSMLNLAFFSSRTTESSCTSPRHTFPTISHEQSSLPFTLRTPDVFVPKKFQSSPNNSSNCNRGKISSQCFKKESSHMKEKQAFAFRSKDITKFDMCNNEKGPVAEKVFGSKNENQPIIGKNFDIQTAETSSISSSISSHSSNTLSSIDSFAQLLKENERGWEPICEINKAQCADANNIEEITKRPEFAEEQKTLLLKKWEEADAKMLNAMGLLKSSDIFISKKLDRNKLERIDDIVKDEDGEKDTNFEQYTKNVEEKAWKRRLSEVNRQLNEAKIFYYLYGEWIRKPWMFDKRELDLWNKTEKKAKWNRQHGQCKFSLATIEEMKSLLKDADKNGITENEQVLIRHQLQKCERITEEDLDNKIVTPFKKYGFIRQKTYNRFIATAGNHSSQRKDEALQEEEQEGEKDPSTSISSLIFDQHSPLLQQEHNKKSTFTQVEFPFVADDTLSSIHSHSISNIDDFSNSLIFHKHQDASSKFPFVSSQMQQPFVSDGFSYHSLLLNPDRTSFYSFLEHPASSAPSLLHKQQLSSDHSCNQNVQHFLEELRDPFRFQAAEDNNTDCSFGINENTSNNEIPIVVSLCWLNYSNGNENDANNQLQREVLQQKERASTKTIKQRLLHLTPPQRKFLWCFDEFIPSLQKQWKKWFQLKGRHYRSMPKKQLAEIFFKYSEPLINDEASSEQKEKIKAMIESTSKNMNIEKEISFTSF